MRRRPRLTKRERKALKEKENMNNIAKNRQGLQHAQALMGIYKQIMGVIVSAIDSPKPTNYKFSVEFEAMKDGADIAMSSVVTKLVSKEIISIPTLESSDTVSDAQTSIEVPQNNSES